MLRVWQAVYIKITPHHSARKRGQVGPCVKTTRTVLLFYNIVQYLYVYYIIIYLFKRQLLSFSEKELLIQ